MSKRLTYTEAKATYSPVREERGRELSSGLGPSAEDGLQARVRHVLLLACLCPMPPYWQVSRKAPQEEATFLITSCQNLKN